MGDTRSEADGRLETLMESLTAAVQLAPPGTPLTAHIPPLLESLGLEELQTLLEETAGHPLLQDVTHAVEDGDTLEIRIALEKELGTAFPLPVHKLDGGAVKVWATAQLQVRSFRERLQRALEKDLREKGFRKSLDWRRVWNTHCLMIPSTSQSLGTVSHGHFQKGRRLLNLEETLEECGVTPESVLLFSPHVVKEKGHRRARHYRYQRPPKKNATVEESVHDGRSHGVTASREVTESHRGKRYREGEEKWLSGAGNRDRESHREKRKEPYSHLESYTDSRRAREGHSSTERWRSDEFSSCGKRVKESERESEGRKRRRPDSHESDYRSDREPGEVRERGRQRSPRRLSSCDRSHSSASGRRRERGSRGKE